MARILVVEDDHPLADLIKQILGIRRYDVLSVFDGFAAVDVAQREMPDLILMDIMLPGQTGIEATRAIRSSADPKLASTPIIAMSAGTTLGSISDDDIFSAILSKPFDVDALLDSVSRNMRSAGSEL